MTQITDTSTTLEDIAARLKESHALYGELTGLSLGKIGDLLNRTTAVMFPHYSVAEEDGLSLEERLAGLEEAFFKLVDRLCKDNVACARSLVQGFLADLPDIAAVAYTDAKALYEGDPAAESIEEVMICYPGFYAVVAYRIAHALVKRGVPFLPRMITEYAHQKTGVDINPGAQIGHSLFIDHGTGVVIGETAVIGNNVKIYQGVTLGALRVDRDERAKKRHPTIEDNVVIYAGATILGGDTVVGHNTVIGGNVWLTRSVPAWSRVMFRPCDTEEIVPIRARQKA